VALAAALFVFPAAGQASFPGAANGKIAYSDDFGCLFTINPDGTGEAKVPTPDNCGTIGLPLQGVWSADGSLLARTAPGGIAIFGPDGSGHHTIPIATRVWRLGGWSPDGSKLVYAGFCSAVVECTDVYVVNLDGSGTTRITNTGGSAWPAWSPAGDRIAFAPSALGIYTMTPLGTNVTKIPNTENGIPSSGAWSPSGGRIAFTKGVGSRFEVFAVNVDGSGLAQLTADGGFLPAWSPDGRMIAFESARSGHSEIYTMNADGTAQTRLTTTTGDGVFDPDWQPIPNKPPDCSSVAASRPVLTTANRRFVAITLDGATDPDGDPVTIAVDGVTQDEPVEGSGDSTSPDAINDGGGQVRIRAERNPHGDGRVYRIAFTATDGRGGSCSGTTAVSVPRKRHKPAVDSAPPSYDSLI
jgi:WD40-like Beta Propeller Repeat